MPTPTQRVIFCDFDGTITAEETFVGMLKTFTPEVSARVLPQLYTLELTLREGVRQMLESIPSSRYPDIIEYTKTKSLRPGLSELLDFLDKHDIPFVVISGGLRGMVEAALCQVGVLEQVTAIYAADVDTRGDYLQVISEFEGETELVSKVDIMVRHPAEEQIAIGDSVTDLNMALTAPIVFARDRLSQYLDERNKPYIPWQDFSDVCHNLAQRWKV